jgi:hypothetical protein
MMTCHHALFAAASSRQWHSEFGTSDQFSCTKKSTAFAKTMNSYPMFHQQKSWQLALSAAGDGHDNISNG